jgi:hypothetical protein
MTGRSLRAVANLVDATFAADRDRVRRVLAGLDRPAADEVTADLLGLLELAMADRILAEAEGHPDDHVLDTYLYARVRQETDQLRRQAAVCDRRDRQPPAA